LISVTAVFFRNVTKAAGEDQMQYQKGKRREATTTETPE
jgi:hypothetical protein